MCAVTVPAPTAVSSNPPRVLSMKRFPNGAAPGSDTAPVPKPGPKAPLVLFQIRMPTAPAATALICFWSNPQAGPPLSPPRAMRTIFPATWAALVSGLHAAAGTAFTTSAVTSKFRAPCAIETTEPIGKVCAGLVVSETMSTGPSKTYICIRGGEPSAGVHMLALSTPLKSLRLGHDGVQVTASRPAPVVVVLGVARGLVEAVS